MTQLILYTSEDGQVQVQLRADRDTVWFTQLEMAELFNASKQNISLHLKNIYQDGELEPAATVKESLTVQTQGARDVRRTVTLYNLDAILAVGYRVRSKRGMQFRRWASTVLEGAGSGSVSHVRMEQQIAPLFMGYDQRRKTKEVQAADEQYEAELKALENKIKHRKDPAS